MYRAHRLPQKSCLCIINWSNFILLIEKRANTTTVKAVTDPAAPKAGTDQRQSGETDNFLEYAFQ
ncbi:hypothetical protein GCM10023345_00040 [Acinetobacter kookii]